MLICIICKWLIEFKKQNIIYIYVILTKRDKKIIVSSNINYITNIKYYFYYIFKVSK